MNKKVSDYIFEYLRDSAKVDMVFMLPGGGCMHLVDSLGKTPGVMPYWPNASQAKRAFTNTRWHLPTVPIWVIRSCWRFSEI